MFIVKKLENITQQKGKIKITSKFRNNCYFYFCMLLKQIQFY